MPTSSSMPDVNDILNQQLAEARSQGDRPRQIALAVSLTKERGSDVAALQALIAEASAALIAEHEGRDLDAAAEWAQTWFRHTRQVHARDLHQSLTERAAAVRVQQERLCRAMADSDPVAMRAAITALEASPGRIADTDELLVEAKRQLAQSLTDAKRRLAERLASAAALREELLACVPAALDQALAKLPALQALDPACGDDPELAALPGRVAAVTALHTTITAALAAPALPALERAVAALAASTDRLSDSEALRVRAVAQVEQRRLALAAQRAAYAGADRARPDLAVPMLEALAVLDPEAAELGELPAVRRARERLLELHRVLAAGLLSPGTPGLEAAVDELRASTARLPDSLPLADAVAEAVRRHRALRAALRAQALRVAGIAALMALVVLPIWWRDAHGRAALMAAGDGEQGRLFAQAYADDWTHVFYRGAAAARAALLAQRLDDQAFAAARDEAEPTARLAALGTYLARPSPRHADQAKELDAATRLVLEDHAFALADGVADPERRILAIDAYAARAQVPERATKARAVAAGLRRARDQSVWDRAQAAADPHQRLALLIAYQRLDGEPERAAEAVTLRAATEAAIARQLAVDQDDAAWRAAAAIGEPRQGIASLQAYLAGDTLHAHADEAHRRQTELRAALDDGAWADATKEPDPVKRSAALRAYLGGDTVRAHAGAAESALAEAVWQAAAAPGRAEERVARVRAYLAEPANQLHRADALQLEHDLTQAIDQDLWIGARSVPDLAGRIHAIDAYLEMPGARSFSIAAKDELARCFAALVALPDRELAASPVDILARLPADRLARLPAERLAQLPAAVQAQVAVRPAWCQAAGIDAHGRWADLALGAAIVRFREIFPGTVRVETPGGAASVTVAHGFWLAEQECPQAAWVEVMGGFFSNHNPSVNRGDALPVDSAAFAECQAFVTACNQLLEHRASAGRVRLPSVAEWRFAAYTASEGAAAVDRGAARGFATDELKKLVWSREGSDGRSRAAAVGEADRWGLLNLLGNLAEWCVAEDGSGRQCGGAWNLPLAECLPGRTAQPSATPDLAGTGVRLVIEARR